MDCLQVYMMDKRFLDPRRPKGTPSKDDQAEMLLPFDPELPVVPTLYASHRKTIARISGMLTADVRWLTSFSTYRLAKT